MKISKDHSQMKGFVNFKQVDGLVPEDLDQSLLDNPDQHYLYKLCIGIQRGHLDDNFTYRTCAKINMARYKNTEFLYFPCKHSYFLDGWPVRPGF